MSDINSIYLTYKSNKMQPFDILSKDISRSSDKNLCSNKLLVPLKNGSKSSVSAENGRQYFSKIDFLNRYWIYRYDGFDRYFLI